MTALFTPWAFYAALAVCGLACLTCTALFIRKTFDAATQTFVLISTEWRGLGGGLGGIRISSAFASFLLAAIFGFLTVSLIDMEVGAERASQAEARRYEDARRTGEVELEKARIAAARAAATPAPAPAAGKP